ncbi:MAG TPA: hypothetical protein DCE42_04040 [Myxococcales bacterium]|nr:hypothetical protein [Deltaproteobacteria bacterium]HAA53897.1 hypothetical protein [Myxococcales bacterium]|tara:strand:+ start:9544 stop:10314 length:771 start_codon:yes stop_codon:yes gene_type:complete
MSIVQLTSAAMLLILEYTLSSEVLKLIKSNDLLAAMVPRLQRVKGDLAASREKPSTSLSPEKEREIRGVLQKLDFKHDNLYRSLSLLLALAENASSDEEYQLQIATLSDDLFPFGLNIVRMKWVDEAGEAQRLGKQIDHKETQTLLSDLKITTKEGTMSALDLANSIVSTGQKMSKQLVELVSVDETAGPTSETIARRQFSKLYARFLDLVHFEWEEEPNKVEIVTRAFNEQLAQLAQRREEPSQPSEPTKKPAFS